MTDAAPRLETYTDAQIDAILVDLNANVPRLRTLQAWAEGTATGAIKIREGDDVSYIRLAAHDGAGKPVVLIRIDHLWERANW